MRWGQGRVEVHTLRREILDLINQGHSVAYIHRLLTEAGRLTVSRRRFADLVRRDVAGRAADIARPRLASPPSAQISPTTTRQRAALAAPPVPSAAITSHMPTVTQLPGGTDTDIWGDEHPPPDTDTTDAGAISAEGAAASVAPPSDKDTDNAE